MKKFAKMSLVAAIAVAGTVASAQPLAEAIKNVDVSGTVVYRYNDYNGEATSATEGTDASATSNNYKVGVSLKSKVTDDVTFNSRFLVASGSGSFVSLDTQAGADANVDVTLSHANFAYTGIANTTVVVGKQGLATPWTKAIDSDGSEQTGTGILASTTMGPVTAAAGYFNQHNIVVAGEKTAVYSDAGTLKTDTTVDGTYGTYDKNTHTLISEGSANLAAGKNIAVAALLGSLGPVNAQAWYLDLDELFDAYYVKADATFDLDAVKIGLFAQYADTDNDANNDDVNLLKTGISAKMGIFGASYTYAQTGDEGSGIVNGVAANSMIGWSVNMANNPDAKAHFFNVNAQVLPSLNVALNHNSISADVENADKAAGDEKELYTQITYNHSKNLSAYIRLGQFEFTDAANDDLEDNRGRLQVQYSF